MRVLRQSELDKLRAQVEEARQRNMTVEQRLGYRPHPIQFAEAVIGGSLDEWQRTYMCEALDSSRIAIAACRQSGKSTVTGLFIAWCMVFCPGFQCLVASRSLRQASHFVTIVREGVLAMLPKESIPELNRLSIRLPNGSSVISIPCAQPDAGRGFSPNMVLLDEAAFAPQALFTAISPSLGATGGAMHMISSPNGRQGYFFEAFEGTATDVYSSQRITWKQCPRIHPDFIAQEKIALGELFFKQEYMAEFITPEGAFFGFEALQSFIEGEDEPLEDLELRDLEKWVENNVPLPEPSALDLQRALDRTDRVNRLLHD